MSAPPTRTPGCGVLASITGRPAAAGARHTRELARAALVTESRPGRYHQYDLIATYALEVAAEHESADERDEASGRVLDHFAQTLRRMNERHLNTTLPVIEDVPRPGVSSEIFDDVTAALDWFRANRDNLAAALRVALRRGQCPWRVPAASFEACVADHV